jgi:hypothetical protein
MIMMRIFIAALTVIFGTAMSAQAGDVPAEALAGIEKALTAIGCTVEADDIEAEGDGYQAEEVKCQDGEYDVTFDKGYGITSKEKEGY